MDLIDRIKDISSKIIKLKDIVGTEEGTKNAFIMPFIAALGYDISDPTEVVPEFTADVGTKKGEKIDYAIKKDDDVIILIECKWSGVDLCDAHASQLYRYFSVTDARFAILTNGIDYQFYSDIDEPNKMDSKPFFTFNVLEFQDHQISELKKFAKSSFSLDDILETASTLKYTGAIKKILEAELTEPSEKFVRFFATQVVGGYLTKQKIEQFTETVKEARKQFVNEKINERLKSALSANDTLQDSLPEREEVDSTEEEDGVVITEEEIGGFYVVKNILRETVDVSRVSIRETKKHCGILLDNTNRQYICRLYLTQGEKFIGLVTEEKERKIPIDTVDDIHKYSEQIKAIVIKYLSSSSKK